MFDQLMDARIARAYLQFQARLRDTSINILTRRRDRFGAHGTLAFARRAAIVASLAAVFVSRPAAALIVPGFVDFDAGAFDFSVQVTVTPDDDLADISIGIAVDPPLGWFVVAHNGSGVLKASQLYEDITTAPTDPSFYVGGTPVSTGLSYLVRTREGYYAKFRVLALVPDVRIEFAYQPDGSNVLTGPLPTSVRSWGAIKANYGDPAER